MHRRGGVLLVFGLFVAACSGGGNESPTTTLADGSDVAATGPERADDESAPTAIELDDQGRPIGPPLPGLLDTSDDPIPDDDGVRTGTLENGLTYYVRENDNPGAKATLRLAVKAGSVDELSEATGLAHFVEHMLFNGTDLFPENELVDVLRSFGADFGPDVNAYTSFDETVYTLTVPNSGESVALGISVLEQWLSHATFDGGEVVKERGVVLDEWRVRTQTTSGRLFEVAEQMYLADSAYENRTPIGTDASISAMSESDLRAFYDAWYRPDNAAIIVVGDIDGGDVVGDIEAAFGSAVARTDSMPERPAVTFPIDTDPEFGLHVDPDQQTVDVEVTLPIPGDVGSGTAAARTSLIDSMVYDALIRRLDQDRAAGTAPFDEVTRGGNSFVATLDAPALYAFTDEGRVTETLVTLLDEYARAFKFGFTQDEADLARESLRSFLDTRFDGRDSRQDSDIADALVESFLTGAPYPTIAAEHVVLTELLDAITPEALDLRFRARWANSAPHVIISTPEAVADAMPSADEVLSLVADTYRHDVQPRERLRDLPDALMDRPDPVDAVSVGLLLDTGVPIFDPTVITFPNGVRVLMAANTIIEGQVFFRAVSAGGSSQVADADVVDALYASDVVTRGGVADFNAAELAQLNADDDVSISAWITPYEDNFGGSAATSDLEVMFQMLHLYFTAPRFDPVALDQVRALEEPVVADPASSPTAAGNDALLDARYPGQLRYAVLPTPEQFATLDLAGVERVWNERHADAGDWTFIFAGDFELSEITALSGSYLATLPSTGADEGWIDVGADPPPGAVRVAVEAGTGDTATVTMLFTAPVDGDYVENRVEADIASEVLSARLTRVLRERLGDTYSPFVDSSVTPDPQAVIETYVRISGSPDRVDAIAGVVLEEFGDLASGGLTQTEFDQAFALVAEQYNFVNNNLFIDGLSEFEVYPELGIDSFIDRFEVLSSADRAAVTAFIAEHVPLDRFVQVTVVPR